MVNIIQFFYIYFVAPSFPLLTDVLGFFLSILDLQTIVG